MSSEACAGKVLRRVMEFMAFKIAARYLALGISATETQYETPSTQPLSNLEDNAPPSGDDQLQHTARPSKEPEPTLFKLR